jgi:hypothetical protein
MGACTAANKGMSPRTKRFFTHGGFPNSQGARRRIQSNPDMGQLITFVIATEPIQSQAISSTQGRLALLIRWEFEALHESQEQSFQIAE